MGRQIPTECAHGVIIDSGDFDVEVKNCPICEEEERAIFIASEVRRLGLVSDSY